MKKRYISLISTLLTILVLVTGCSNPVDPPDAATAVTLPSTSELAQNPTSTEVMTAFEQTLGNIYEQVNPSVVNIRVVQKEEITFPSLPEIPGFPFFSFPIPEEPEEYYRRGLGSGFVWDKEGHIITNNHVIEGADRISVTFYDGTTVSGNVVGTDPDSDLAVVRVETSYEQLKPVQIADSTKIKVGQLAVAIGNPFGLEGTMTIGFVSALGRLLTSDTDIQTGSTYSIPDVIQTDAPINPGNSGGVLVDSNGRVIGVTSAIISSSGSNAGIGFAIPSAIVKKVVPELIEAGYYEHPWLGISGTSLSPDLAKAMGLEPDQRGALVVDVVPESPADKADLRGSDRQVDIDGEQVRVGGDVITGINGEPVKEFYDIVTYLARATEIGQTVDLTLLREGKQIEVKATLAARPQTQKQIKQTETEASNVWLGILGMTLNGEIAEAMDLPSDQKGVLVEQVYSGSPADEAGLRGSYKPITIEDRHILVGGDVITALNNEPVDQIEELQSLIQKHSSGDEVTLNVLRESSSIEIKVTLAKQPTS